MRIIVSSEIDETQDPWEEIPKKSSSLQEVESSKGRLKRQRDGDGNG